MRRRKSDLSVRSRSAERARRRQLNKTEEQKRLENLRNKERAALRRAQETPEQREARLEEQRWRARRKRIALKAKEARRLKALQNWGSGQKKLKKLKNIEKRFTLNSPLPFTGMFEGMCESMNVIIKEEIDDLENVKQEIQDEEFQSVEQMSQDNWSETDNFQLGEEVLPFEFIKLEPVADEYQFITEECEEVSDLSQEKFYSYVDERIEVKEEFEEVSDMREEKFYSYLGERNGDNSTNFENTSHTERVLIPFEYKHVEPSEQSDQSDQKFLPENLLETASSATRNNIILGTKQIFQNNQRLYSLLRPECLQNSTTSPSANQPPIKVVIQKFNDKVPSPEFKISLWETAQILMRREQDRKRKALRRARETEEEKNIRRRKERLARAARRARESLEKKLMRRERDRKAKAVARAIRIEQERLRQLGKNVLVKNETKIG